ncbi:MAG: heavy metal translocating P-type ATPase, partial [Chitinophagaceae bacterium]
MEQKHDTEEKENLELGSLTKLTDGQDGHDHAEGDVHEHSDSDGHDHGRKEEDAGWKSHWDLLLAFAILVTMVVLRFGFHFVPDKWIDLSIHAVAFLLAGWRVLDLAFRKAKRGDFFNEFVLMSVATLGAFYIGSY